MNRCLRRRKRLLAGLLLVSCSQPPIDSETRLPEPELVTVLVKLNENGQVLEAKAESGKPELHELAVEAARARAYTAPCDLDGSPISSTTKALVYFDSRQQVLKIEEPIRVGRGLVSSRLTRYVRPRHPGVPGSQRQSVIVRLFIGADGRVNRAEALRGPQELRQSALETARKWEYKPTYLNCRPVPVIVTAVVVFD